MKTKRLTKAQEKALAWVRELVRARVQLPFASSDYELTPRGEAL